MPESLLNQGLTLMLAGMGTVFVFLTILVAVMSLMASLVRRFEPTAGAPSAAEIAAISAAIARHRNS
ncbi:MAG: OadG family protein [Woeseiaceae bacterium]|nr:OadG family protein [Woeseiaceae bacterium]